MNCLALEMLIVINVVTSRAQEETQHRRMLVVLFLSSCRTPFSLLFLIRFVVSMWMGTSVIQAVLLLFFLSCLDPSSTRPHYLLKATE